MSPEFMSEDIPTDINNELEASYRRPSKPMGKWAASEIDDLRLRIRSVFDKMGVIGSAEISQDNSSKFQQDAGKELKKEVLELEATDPTHAHLGESSDPLGLGSESQESEHIKSAT